MCVAHKCFGTDAYADYGLMEQLFRTKLEVSGIENKQWKYVGDGKQSLMKRSTESFTWQNYGTCVLCRKQQQQGQDNTDSEPIQQDNGKRSSNKGLPPIDNLIRGWTKVKEVGECL